MVRFIDKTLKAHRYIGEEKLQDIMDPVTRLNFVDLLINHIRNFGRKDPSVLTHLLLKTTIQLGITAPLDLKRWVRSSYTRLGDVFLFIEIILETYTKNKSWLEEEYILDFVQDVNDFFLVRGVELQIRYFMEKDDFYIEKIISSEVSDKIKETLDNFSGQERVFEDFKEAIKKYSVGDYPESIKLCCKSLEDYLCVILGKQSCPSVTSYYKDASQKLKIPDDLDNRFTNITSYIHNHRSIDLHGKVEKVIVEDLELVSEVIIQFTMVILNYLKNKHEKNKP